MISTSDVGLAQQPARMHARLLCSHDTCMLLPFGALTEKERWACRFSGAQQINQPRQGSFRGVESPGPPPESAAYGDIDGEAAQHLRRLSKRDPTTKVKALQVWVGAPLPLDPAHACKAPASAWKRRAGDACIIGSNAICFMGAVSRCASSRREAFALQCA